MSTGTLYSRDGSYTGEFGITGLEGKGVYTFKNGEKFEGTWKNNHPVEGTGTYFLDAIWSLSYSATKDGYIEKVTGAWKDGQPFGYGTFTYRGGARFYGTVKEFKHHGYGTLIKANGEKQSGEWKEGVLDGQCELISADGSTKYVGPVKNDQIEGVGTVSVNGRSLTIQFRNNKPDGKGEMTLENGKRIPVEFQNGKRVRGFSDEFEDLLEAFMKGYKIGSFFR